jgi:hypothetical protein
MRLPFSRKRTVAVGKSQMELIGLDYSMAGSSSAMDDSDYAVHLQSNVTAHDHVHDQYDGDSEESTKKKGVGPLLRRLNCAASKKDVNMENMMCSAPERYPTGRGWRSEEQTASEITRPVLITVKDGEVPYVTPANESRPIELKNSFVVGQAPTRPSFSTGLAASLRQSKSIRSISTPSRAPARVSFQTPKQQRRNTSKDMHDFVTAQEKARRQRWRKGLERSFNDHPGVRSPAVPSLISENDSAFGCSSTGYNSGASGPYSDNSVHTDYTAETISDESEAYFTFRGAPNRGPPNRGQYRTSPPRQQQHPRRTGSQISSSEPTSMWAGVTEDLGIIAGMLLSDGTACMGSVAAITQESVADSCKAPTHVL